MLTLKQIYDNTEAIIAGLEKKHFNGAREIIGSVIAIDQERKVAQPIVTFTNGFAQRNIHDIVA